MPRRKNAYLSDGSDSDASVSQGSEGGFNSQEDEDSRAERALFEYSGRKRRKMGARRGKEVAWEGIFGENDNHGPPGGRGLGAKGGGRGGAAARRTDWTKAPAFVSKPVQPDPSTLPTDEDEERASATTDDENGASDIESDSETPSRPASPRIRETDYGDEDGTPHLGLGVGTKGGYTPSNAPTPGAAAEDQAPASSRSRGRGGIGSVIRRTDEHGDVRPAETFDQPKGGLVSSALPSPQIPTSIPAPFGRPPPALTGSSGPSRAQRSFLAKPTSSGTATPTELTAQEAARFRKIESSFGARMLANLGWAPGKGLGINEDGRAVPVEVGKVLRGQGIQKGIRTEDSKREARRKGETISDEEDKPMRRGKKAHGGSQRIPKSEAEQGWKRQKKVKVKVEHKTYEQLLAEAGDAAAPGVGLVLDARGGELKAVQSLSDLSLNWVPTADSMRLPELRHNLRLVVDVSKGDVDALAREGKSVNERRRWTLREEELSRKKVDNAEKQISRLRNIQETVATVIGLASQEASAANPSLAPLTESFDRLVHDFHEEYVALKLEDVVVGAIGQIMRSPFADWQPFDVSSDVLLTSLKPWRKAYNLPRDDADDSQALIVSDVHGDGVHDGESQRSMTAWEGLLWSLWLPKVRAAINNEWDPTFPHSAVHLLESWDSILPPFIRDNILDQLILPKVKKAVEEWDPRRSRSSKSRPLAGVVFPWLPLLGERIEEILDIAKRRIRSVMRDWVVKDKVPEELGRWKKDIYSSSEWDKLVLQYVVPKLGVCLRDDFTINPRKQDMVPLEDWVLPWHNLLRPSMFSHLLEVEFFPKWLEILYIWLIQPFYKPDEVANWFIWWKGRFPDPVLEMRGIAHGFNQGLELMNEAMRLGADAPTKLQKPIFKPLPPGQSNSKPSKATPRKPVAEFSDPIDITFRNLAEDYAARHDLIFLPLGRSHAQTGKPLFKVSKGVDGKGGLTVYIGENAVFAQGDEGTFRAVSLEDMVKRAGA